ncbi:hypothetical protein MPER_02783, partial [Moniliophthora perniciosa FA553]
EFIGSNLYAATVRAFFGPHFSPETWSDFALLDRNMYYLLNWIPFHGKEGREARSRFVSHIGAYLEAARSQDEGQLEGVPDFVSNMVGEMVKSGLSFHEQTSALLMILWGMNGNIIQVVFWTLSYLMAEPDVLKQVTADIRNAVTETANDVETLLDMEPPGFKTFVPWGGGLSMCKGRNYARHIYKIFLVLCLDMFDIEVPPEGLPLPAVAEKALTVPMLPTYDTPTIRLRASSRV